MLWSKLVMTSRTSFIVCFSDHSPTTISNLVCVDFHIELFQVLPDQDGFGPHCFWKEDRAAWTDQVNHCVRLRRPSRACVFARRVQGVVRRSNIQNILGQTSNS